MGTLGRRAEPRAHARSGRVPGGRGCHRAYLASGETRDAASIIGSSSRSSAGFSRGLAHRRHRRAGRREIEALYSVPPDRLSVVYNGVDLDRFHPENRARTARGARRSGHSVGRVHRPLRGQRLRAQRARHGDRSVRHARRSGQPTGRSRQGRPGAVRRALASRLGVGERIIWLGRATIPSAGTPPPTSSCCRPVTSRSATFTSRRSRPGLPVVASARAGGAELIETGPNGAVADPTDPRGDRVGARAVSSAPQPGTSSGAARALGRALHLRGQVDGFAATVAGYDSEGRDFA